MENDDIASRVNNIHKIPIVLSLMSNDAIKNTLLPYLEGKNYLIKVLSKRKMIKLYSRSLKSWPMWARPWGPSIPPFCRFWNPSVPMMRLLWETGLSNRLASSSKNTLTMKSITLSCHLYNFSHADHPACLQLNQLHVQGFCYSSHQQCLSQSWPQQRKTAAVKQLLW